MKENLIQLKETANAILTNEVPGRHSFFQLQCFVLAKEPTVQGKLYYCLKEIKAKKQSLDALELEIGEQKDKLELLELDLIDMQEEENTKRKEIKVRGILRRQNSLKNSIQELANTEKNLSEELQFFCLAFDQLNKKEKLKPWDDPDVQKEYWSQKLHFDINTRLLLRQLPDIELLKTVMCLPDDTPLKINVLNMLKPDPNKSLEQKTT